MAAEFSSHWQVQHNNFGFLSVIIKKRDMRIKVFFFSCSISSHFWSRIRIKWL